jgi:hypothetical protein
MLAENAIRARLVFDETKRPILKFGLQLVEMLNLWNQRVRTKGQADCGHNTNKP